MQKKISHLHRHFHYRKYWFLPSVVLHCVTHQMYSSYLNDACVLHFYAKYQNPYRTKRKLHLTGQTSCAHTDRAQLFLIFQTLHSHAVCPRQQNYSKSIAVSRDAAHYAPLPCEYSPFPSYHDHLLCCRAKMQIND